MTYAELKDRVNGNEPAYCHDCGTRHRPDDECPYWRHVKGEGDNYWNDHPDGCYHCGSMHHHSSDCRTDGEGNWGYDVF